MFNWPENIIPLPTHNFDVDAEFANIRSKMDTGRVRQRPRFSRDLELSNVRFELDQFSYSIFKSIWVTKLNRGNDWFTMRLPIANNESLTLSEVRFVSDYKASHLPVGNWDISATIEFQETGNISEDMLDLYIIYGESGIDLGTSIIGIDTIFPRDWEY